MNRLLGLGEYPARAQLQKVPYSSGVVEPLPQPYSPGRITSSDVGFEDPGATVSFFVLGDVGGINSPGPQNAVSVAMEQHQGEAAFVLILGDVVYYNGQESDYMNQFYEPYAKLQRAILAFPGNHDGDPAAGDTSLAGFMTNFCDKQPSVPAVDPELEYGRHTQTLPYCDWTLDLEAVTIVTVYSNVPAGGHLEPEQTAWLTQELKDADTSKPLILGLHHPPYSIDAHHGGSATMGAALDQAFSDAGRTPDLVLSGHVHDYQRFTRTIGGKQVPYIVSGAGGYYNLHQLASGASPGEELASGVIYEFGEATQYGFLKLTVAGGKISGEYVGAKPGTMPDGSDATVTAGVDTF
jgi:acid phosphatase type 7